MTTRQTISLGIPITGADARIIATLDARGGLTEATFDLADLPRIEPMLRGRNLADVVRIVERVCGICPVAHHLAGARALEAAQGIGALTPTADAVRRLLQYAMVLHTHAVTLMFADPVAASALRAFGQAAVRAAGGPGHFPKCAVVGGVESAVTAADRDALHASAGDALAAASALVEAVRAAPAGRAVPAGCEVPAGRAQPAYAGLDVALVDDGGALDLFGSRLRAVAPDGSVVVDGATPADWPSLVSETRPGVSASRPVLHADGREWAYRVGPVAQLRVAEMGGPLARAAQHQWRAVFGGPAGGRVDVGDASAAMWARAVVALHAVETLSGLLGCPELVDGPLIVGAPATSWRGAGKKALTCAVGWVDGARGLLVHRYETEPTGVVQEALITTPTTQNEPWLAELLAAALPQNPGTEGADGGDDWGTDVEAAVREADPCLPCTALPPGHMGVSVDFCGAGGALVTQWHWSGADSTGGSALTAHERD